MGAGGDVTCVFLKLRSKQVNDIVEQLQVMVFCCVERKSKLEFGRLVSAFCSSESSGLLYFI